MQIKYKDARKEVNSRDLKEIREKDIDLLA